MKIYHVHQCGILIATFANVNDLIIFVGNKYGLYWYSEAVMGQAGHEVVSWDKLRLKTNG